jgi:UDP-glucose 4-epimerase
MVTGGAGFIGSHVCDALLKAGHALCVVDDLSTGRRENLPTGVGFEQGDILDAAFVAGDFERFEPEVVSHQAAQTSVSVSVREPARDASINVVGSVNLLAASARSGVQRFVFASTGGAIYGEVPDGQRASTRWTPSPRSPYACSKLAVEAYLRAFSYEHALPYTVLRYANVYGPRQDPHGEAGVVAIFTQRSLAGQALCVNARVAKGDDGCVRDYVYVDDVVKANLRAVAGEIEAPIVNVCTGVETATASLAARIMDAVGTHVAVDFAARRSGDVERSVLEGGEQAVPEGAVPLSQGIVQTVAWFRDQRR